MFKHTTFYPVFTVFDCGLHILEEYMTEIDEIIALLFLSSSLTSIRADYH